MGQTKVAEKSWLGPVRRAANKAGTLLGDPKLWEEPRETSLCECTYGEGSRSAGRGGVRGIKAVRGTMPDDSSPSQPLTSRRLRSPRA